MNREFTKKDVLKTYKKIMKITDAHLTRHQPDANINITRGKYFAMSSRPSAKAKGRGVESALRRR